MATVWKTLDCNHLKRYLSSALLVLCFSSFTSARACDRNESGQVGTSGSISSPGFPQSYPKRSSTYTCNYGLNVLNDGVILLVFDDFHLDDEQVYSCKNNGTDDYLAIIPHTGLTPGYYCGYGRPPMIISSSSSLSMQLVIHPGKGTASFRGFSVRWKFITLEEKMELTQMYLREDTSVPSYSGGQGLIKMVISAIPPQYSDMYSTQTVDMLWYITAPTQQDRILLRVLEFTHAPHVDNSMLEIRDGPTSQSSQLQYGRNIPKESIASSNRFMYVRLTRTVGVGTSLNMEFSFFRGPDTFLACPPNYFMCVTSQRCIPKNLKCNDKDNCGANEDESFQECHGSPTIGSACLGECFNNGRCVNGECQCTSQFFGIQCEFPVANTNYNDLEHTSVMIGAFVGAVCLLSICWLVAMARKRYTETEADQRPRPPQRMVSIHSPEELGLRRSATVGPGDLEIPPDYNDVFLFEDADGISTKPRPILRSQSVNSANEPWSPPPSYDAVASVEDMGIIIECPHLENEENQKLPDVVESNEPSPSMRSSKSTDV